MTNKLDNKYLRKSYRDAYIKQYSDKLTKDGYKVSLEKNLGGVRADLLATKDNETKVYEFKEIGKGDYRKGQFEKTNSRIRELKMEPIIVYYKVPQDKSIVFNGLDSMIFDFFTSDGIPEAIDSLSSHCEIEEVIVDEDSIISVSFDKTISLNGNALINGTLQYGSNTDIGNDDGYMDTFTFPFEFALKLNGDLNIIDMVYTIDTSSFYN